MKKKLIYGAGMGMKRTIAAICTTLILLTGGAVSAQGDLGWKVWVKTSPCSGRFDWVTVAKENPTYGAGGGNWENADLIVTGTGMKCVRNIDQTCTKAAAAAEAAIVRASSKFSDYCCKEYSVWQNSSTRKMTVVVGKFATAGYGWQKVQGDLCCAEAEALSGIAGACSGRGQQGGSYVGCFKDTGTFDLNGFLVRSQSNTPQACIATCLAKGFAFAAVQYSESCLCGNSYGKYGAANNCNMKCTGDASQTCGGYSANSVYSTGTDTSQTSSGRTGGGGSARSQCSQPPTGCQLQQVTTQPETRDGAGRITVEASLIHMMNCVGGPTYIYQYVNRRGFRVIHPPNWSNAIGGRDFGTCQEAQSVAVNALRPGAHPAGGEGQFAIPPLPSTAVQPSVTDISGTWRGTDGTVYQITQHGASFTWTSRGGSETAQGTINGNSVSASWRNSSGSGGGGASVIRDTAGRPISVRWSNGNVFTR